MSCAINNNNFSDSQESSVVDVSIPLFNGLAAMNRKYAEEVIMMMANHGLHHEGGKSRPAP